jgi:hypothetical protein
VPGGIAAAAIGTAKKFNSEAFQRDDVGNFEFQILEFWANIQIADRPP